MLIVSVPVLAEIDYILGVWLVEVPVMAGLFTRLVILESLFDTLAGPMITSLMATGRIKWYQIVVGSILLLNIPIAYLLLKAGYHIATPLIVSIVFMLIGNFSRMVFCRNMLGLSLRNYLRTVLSPIIIVSLLSVIPVTVVVMSMEQGFVRLAVNVLVGVITVCFFCYTVGLTKGERKFIINAIRPRLVRIKNICC